MQVYIVTGQAGRPGQSVVEVPQIGQTLSSARTNALTAVHCSPEHPAGWKANDVPPLLIAEFTVQSGLPLLFAEISTAAPIPPEYVMVFCVPAIWVPATPVSTWTSMLRPVSPIIPLVEPMLMIAGLVVPGVGVGPPPPTVTLPSVVETSSETPFGSLAPASDWVSG